MTIQNWRLTADQATVVCDSLGSSVDDWSAIGMVSKCWVVPHLGIVLAAKNWMLPGLNLYLHLAHGLAIQRWSDLVARAPTILRETAANHSRHYLEHAGDCRVAAFGYDDRAGIIAGCLFEGDSNFEPQPVTALDVRMPDPPGLPADDWNRALAQQAYDLALPKGGHGQHRRPTDPGRPACPGRAPYHHCAKARCIAGCLAAWRASNW
jgi:hypothetical protein